jgi:Ni/Co efflux regulator RcnB
MLKALVPAAFVTILAATSLSAAPAVSPLAQLNTIMPAGTVQVRDKENRGNHRNMKRHNRRGQHYTPGRRYKSAPSHYRRYAHRPYNWRSRGCILVGPVWFCA